MKLGFVVGRGERRRRALTYSVGMKKRHAP